MCACVLLCIGAEPWLPGVVDRAELAEAIYILSLATDDAAPMAAAPTHDCVQERLSTHLFGGKRRHGLEFKDYCKFVRELKADVLRAEFYQYTLGNDTMTYG